MSTVPTIHLPRKSEKRFILEGKEYVMSIDAQTIQHFQKTSKKGFLKSFQNLQKFKDGIYPVQDVIRLLGSSVKDENGKPVGWKFFEPYDEFSILNTLFPMLSEVINMELPIFSLQQNFI